jgi:predicted nucleic acid-binding protein
MRDKEIAREITEFESTLVNIKSELAKFQVKLEDLYAEGRTDAEAQKAIRVTESEVQRLAKSQVVLEAKIRGANRRYEDALQANKKAMIESRWLKAEELAEEIVEKAKQARPLIDQVLSLLREIDEADATLDAHAPADLTLLLKLLERYERESK